MFDIYKNKQLTVAFFDLCIQNPLIHFYCILILVVISIMINILKQLTRGFLYAKKDIML